MILIVGTVRIPADGLEVALPAMATMVAASRAEAGCIHYAYAQDVLDPTVIHVSEAWRDRAALAAHFATPHLAAWRTQFAELGITDRDLKLYETDEGEPV
ncbi:antibiotic biosynthesis monooxygenase [Tsuneonella flava]|uniref:Antibiotic biosynthesis monooxygenase n=1 Tax=Tsuneonella flava TaxID=2055955 RepID=A0ABX7KCB8_9SPHN|nr:putative quinol monooxygenase [Tsuneonella flava]QSB44701.1 antibiotic biosynthesis monooxygenase [Tsuneonella flava]